VDRLAPVRSNRARARRCRSPAWGYKSQTRQGGRGMRRLFAQTAQIDESDISGRTGEVEPSHKTGRQRQPGLQGGTRVGRASDRHWGLTAGERARHPGLPGTSFAILRVLGRYGCRPDGRMGASGFPEGRRSACSSEHYAARLFAQATPRTDLTAGLSQTECRIRTGQPRSDACNRHTWFTKLQP
jgi:hypothetical protein